jgi:hypothetical protein
MERYPRAEQFRRDSAGMPVAAQETFLLSSRPADE